MKVEKAKIGDIPQIHWLVNHFAEKSEMLPRALSDIYENMREFFVVREDDKVIACAALHNPGLCCSCSCKTHSSSRQSLSTDDIVD